MLFNYDYKITTTKLKSSKSKAIMLAKKMLPEYIFDTAQMENNPITFPEVKTLMDGVTIGGHKISDVEQVISIKKAWQMLLSDITDDTFIVSKSYFHRMNKIIAENEAIFSGKFRNGSVGIAGTTTYKAPNFEDLETIFFCELPIIMLDFHPIEQAIRLFLWATLNQFYWDGNKRTARLIANGILLNSGIGVFNIRARDILEFNTLMLNFYDSLNADNIVKFLADKAIVKLSE